MHVALKWIHSGDNEHALFQELQRPLRIQMDEQRCRSFLTRRASS